MKKLTLFSAVVAASFLLIGCSTEKQEFETIHQNNEEYLQSFTVLKENAFKEDITPIITKAGSFSSDTKALKVCFPVEKTPLVPEIKNVNCLNDLQNLASKYAASFEITDGSEISGNTVLISEAKTSASMAAMIKQSKQYLNSLGMTDADIQQMLKEENADESTLVPFTLSLMEHDNNSYYTWLRTSQFSLIPCAYAIDWGQVGQCSLRAIGADIFFGLGTSMAKAWTKAAIKKAFKAAAEKILGPVGVAIAVIDFALCMEGIEI